MLEQIKINDLEKNNELGVLLDSTKTIDDLINSGVLKTESDPITPYNNIDKN